MHTLAKGHKRFRQRSQPVVFQVCPVAFCNAVVVINIIVLNEIAVDVPGLLHIKHMRFLSDHNGLACKIFHRCFCGPFIQGLFDAGLQIGDKIFIAFAGDNRQHVDGVDGIGALFHVHPFSSLVYTQAQAAAHFLAFLCGACAAVLQCADLKNIGVVPAFPQGRVGKDKTHRFLKAQKAFFIFKNQVIGGNVIAFITSPLDRTVHLAAVLVNAEIPRVGFGGINAFQVTDVRRVFKSDVIVQHADILLLEHFSVFGVDFFPSLVILTVLGHFVYKEQGKGLDAQFKQVFFLFKMRNNGLPDLDPAHVLF